MEKEIIKRIDEQLKWIKCNNPAIHKWIILKEQKKNLKELISSDEIWKKLQDIEAEMKYMKEYYSSIMLYDALTSVKEKILKNNNSMLD